MIIPRLTLAALLGALVFRAVPARAVTCGGDCDSDSVISISDLTLSVAQALGTGTASCPAADINEDGRLRIEDLLAILACASALEPSPTPSPTPTPTATPLGTDDVPPTDALALLDWLRAGRYRAWTAESAVHPSGGPHGSSGVRTFLNDAVVASLASGNAAHPTGAALVKELYRGNQVLSGWAVEIKIQADSAGGNGWYWWEGVGLSGRGLGVCTGCHAGGIAPGYVSKDYVLTPFPLEH
jgi:hypothetical protein